MFDRIKAAILAQTSVVASAATGYAALAQAVRDEAAKLAAAGADTADLDALAGQIEANTATLAQAVAVNTDASDEVHADDGGTGDADTVVEPTPAAIEPAPADEAAAGDQGQQQGGDAGQQE